MSKWMLTVEAQDRPGIIASITKALANAGCNLADVSMTRLSGVFVMLAVVNTPGDSSPQNLWNDAASFAGEVTWKEITDQQSTPQLPQGDALNVTVYGSDKPGIVAAITDALASHGININDLSTRLVGDGDAAAYTMLIDATAPAGSANDSLVEELRSIGEQLGVSCHANLVDTDTL